STSLLAVPAFSETSFMAATKSATRATSVLSMSLMFSCAPLRTSCRRILASRRRSYSAVVSARNMLCVSCISLTAADAVCLDCSTGVGRVLQLLERAADGLGRALRDHFRGLAQFPDRAVERLARGLARGDVARLQVLERLIDGAGRGLARLADQAGDLLAVLR